MASQQCTFTPNFYLLTAYFDSYKDDRDNVLQRDWHTKADLTQLSELTNVRPMPFTPIVVFDEENPRLWGSNEQGLLHNLSYPNDKKGGGAGVSLVVNEQAAQTNVQFAHSCAITTLKNGNEYALAFPPLHVLGQLSNAHTQLSKLHDKLNELYKSLIEHNSVTSDSGLADSNHFTATKVAVEQLAPAYVAKQGKLLTSEQESYNQWLDEVKNNAVDGIIEGFIVPSFYTLGVVFSDDMYVGADVSIIEIDSATHKEQVLATGVVIKPDPYEIKDDNLKLAQPCAIVHFDPSKISDGHYLVRVEFWHDDYIQRQKAILDDELKAKLPESIKQGRLRTNEATRSGSLDDLQDIYSYDLHEKIVFKPLSGFGKLAIVCGDLLSLEESLIYQFPNFLPSYDEFMASEADAKAKQQVGVSSVSLSSVVAKNVATAAQGYATGGSLPYDGQAGNMMRSIGGAIWNDVLNTKSLPPSAAAATAFYGGVTSLPKAYKTLKDAIEEANSGRNYLLFDSKRFVNTHIFSANPNSQITKDITRILDADYYHKSTQNLSSTWLSRAYANSVKEDFEHINAEARKAATLEPNKAAKLGRAATGIIGGINTAMGIEQFYQTQCKVSDNKEDAKYLAEDFDNLATNYLKTVSTTYAEQDWATQLIELSKILDEGDDSLAARVVADGKGAVINMLYCFNEWEALANSSDSSQLKQTCLRLAELLNQNPTYKLYIDGHAGGRGTEPNNLEASKRRAMQVQEYILAVATDKASMAERLVTQWHGSSQPYTLSSAAEQVSPKPTDPTAQDRRVELRLLIPSLHLSLPPSRSGALEMEKSRQAIFSNMAQAQKLGEEQLSQILAALTTVASFTPFAPAIACFMVAKQSATILMQGVDFIDALFFEETYKKARNAPRHHLDLRQLGQTYNKVLQNYWALEGSVIEQRFSNDEQGQQALAKFCGDAKNAKELQRRFLQRAMALNGLMEIMAFIGAQLAADKTQTREALLEQFKVKQYIELFVLNDNWRPPMQNSSTLGSRWRYACHHDNASKAELAVGRDTQSLIAAMQRSAFKESFCTGFPIQASLFLDKPEGFTTFAKDFDATVKLLKGDEIGFVRLLVLENPSDSSSWKAYKNWRQPGKTQRITPFTRLKLQVVLKKAPSSTAKTLYKVRLEYGVHRLLGDINGPVFDVMMSHKTQNELTPCKADNKPLEQYFAQEFKVAANSEASTLLDSATLEGDEQAEPEVQSLCALEFEPSYWFGNYEISGVKPLYSEVLGLWQNFDTWKSSGGHKRNEYYFKLDDNKLFIDPDYHEERSKDDYYLGTLQSKWWAFNDRRAENHRRCHFIYGIDGGNSVGTGDEPYYVYNGLGNVKVALNETDLLVEHFVTTRSAQKGKSLSPYAKGDLKTVAALHIGGKYEWFDAGNQKPNPSTSLESTHFDWENEQESAIFIAFIADEDSGEEYAKQDIDVRAIQLAMKLGIEERHLASRNATREGPTYYGHLHCLYDLEYEIKVEVDTDANEVVLSYPYIEANALKHDHEIEQLPALQDFAKQVIAEIKKQPADYLTVIKRKRKLFVARFELDYISPTGKKVQGLRPFGEIFAKPGSKLAVSSSSTEIFPSQLFLQSLTQEGVIENNSKYLPKHRVRMNLKGSDDFDSDSMPWVQPLPENKANSGNKISIHWQSLINAQDTSKRRAWLVRWVEDSSYAQTTLAPEPRGTL